jgi:hypothetical protein
MLPEATEALGCSSNSELVAPAQNCCLMNGRRVNFQVGGLAGLGNCGSAYAAGPCPQGRRQGWRHFFSSSFVASSWAAPFLAQNELKIPSRASPLVSV